MCVSLVTQLRFQEVSGLESVIEEGGRGGGGVVTAQKQGALIAPITAARSCL